VQTFGIFAAGYLARPLGGIVMAHFGDLVGRKKMFTLSILLMAVPTLAIGLLPTYASMGIVAPLLLLLMRVLQGRRLAEKCRARGCLWPSMCRSAVSGLPAEH
jgi:MFS family permease